MRPRIKIQLYSNPKDFAECWNHVDVDEDVDVGVDVDADE